MSERIKLAVTMGDPAGIGAEIIVKSLKNKDIYDVSVPIVVGDMCALKDAARFCGINVEFNAVTDPSEGKGIYGTVDVIDMGFLKENSWEYGKNSVICGEASFNYIIKAIELANKKEVDAVITAPINKESINMAGHRYNGHTEIFAEYTNTKDFAMLLASGSLRVIHVTTHVALRDACRLIKKERVLKVIQLAETGLKMLGIKDPKIGVAGLNPHCSENGLFGTEEAEEIIPAIKEAQTLGINVVGPESPDTVFVKCSAGKYDIVVAMYHDQGHIPLKLNGFKFNKETNLFETVSGINCTIGLPVIRASVDHGTAFGKAGKGMANADSMVDAVMTGIKMAQSKIIS